MKTFALTLFLTTFFVSTLLAQETYRPELFFREDWKENQGYGQQYHFSVQAAGADCFELLFDSSDFSWQLARVCLEG